MTRAAMTNLRRVFVGMTAFVSTLIFTLSAAYATNVDATKDVVPTKVEHKWFYWVGWIFMVISVVVFISVIVAFIRSIIIPKYIGRKVAQ